MIEVNQKPEQEAYNMQWHANWIRPAKSYGSVCPAFRKTFFCPENVVSAALRITAMGVYEASLNGSRVGDFILAPGWTVYQKRLQVQQYELRIRPGQENELTVLVGKGWYRGRLAGWLPGQNSSAALPAALTAELTLRYPDGHTDTICTDASWQTAESAVRFSELYDGETYDAAFEPSVWTPAVIYDGPTDTLIEQQGEPVREQERIAPARIFKTPAGEIVVDFGQNLTGYVEIALDGAKGEAVELSHAEVLDKNGNFYTENYRSAKAKYLYFCKDGAQRYKPKLTFYGFRYIRVDRFPCGAEHAAQENFTAIAVHSDMKRTGYLSCSDPLLNKLFENVIWGQKSNFLDVPTDCPQRDERLGWTGDAQVFIRTACLNFDAERFFTKWLADLAADQREDGAVGHVIPNVLHQSGSAAWDDAATICPWAVYLAYGDPNILRAQFASMKKWVDYITAHTTTKDLWTGGEHYGDWLGLDAPSGSYKGSSREDLIASAFYAHSTALVIKAGRVLGQDISAYEALYERIVRAFRQAYPVYQTQTECTLAVYFALAEDTQKTADQLAQMIRSCGTRLQTGFAGTPYLLHALSAHGYTELAYDLLLRREYPSWLYPVTKGATTIWEHWDGQMENGDFWSSDMNSFNHYAYGAVADWVYTVAAGIQTVKEKPGYAAVRIAPQPDKRLDWLEASVETRHGLVRSRWEKQRDMWRYEIETPVEAEVVIDGRKTFCRPGRYIFFSELA